MRKQTFNQVIGTAHVVLSSAAGVALCFGAYAGSLHAVIAALAFAVVEDALVIWLLVRERSELHGRIEMLQTSLLKTP
jgi:hypothetical protein